MNNMQENEVIKSDFYFVDGVVKSTDSGTMGKEAGVSDSTKVSLTKETLTLLSQKPAYQESLNVNSAPGDMSMPKFVTDAFVPANQVISTPESINNSLNTAAGVSQTPETIQNQVVEPLGVTSIPEPPSEAQIPLPSSEPKFNVDIPVIGEAQKSDATVSLNNQEPISEVTQQQVINEPVFESVANVGVQETPEPKLENPAMIENVPVAENAPIVESSPTVVSAPIVEQHSSGNDFSNQDLEDLKATLNSLKESLNKKVKTATDFAILLDAFKEDIAKINKIETKVNGLSVFNNSQETTQLVGESELDAAINRGFDKVDLATQLQAPFEKYPSVQTSNSETFEQPKI